VVEGSVVRSGGRVRITAQLIHAPTDRHLWARSYERPLEDVLALQGEVARAIAEEVHLTLGAQDTRRLTPERAVKPDAYDAYLLGRHHWNQRTEPSLDRALEHFRTAIARDPDFALAHAGLALAYAPRPILGYVPPGRGLAEQKAAALRALALDPALGDARAALAAARVQEWDWEGAEAEFRRAVEADPNSSVGHLWYGWYLHAQGRTKESLEHRRRALALDPLSGVVNRSVARDLAILGQDAAALEQWNRTLELEPDRASSHLEVALFHFERGRAAAAASHLEQAQVLQPDDPPTLAHLAVVHAVTGDTAEARRLLGRLRADSARRYVSPVLPAYVHAALDERDDAFGLLERAYAARDPLLVGIQACEAAAVVYMSAQRTAALRADPRYGDLVRRMGLGSPPAGPGRARRP
jgi:Tfp pilus assembly protein PilF